MTTISTSPISSNLTVKEAGLFALVVGAAVGAAYYFKDELFGEEKPAAKPAEAAEAPAKAEAAEEVEETEGQTLAKNFDGLPQDKKDAILAILAQGEEVEEAPAAAKPAAKKAANGGKKA